MVNAPRVTFTSFASPCQHVGGRSSAILALTR